MTKKPKAKTRSRQKSSPASDEESEEDPVQPKTTADFKSLVPMIKIDKGDILHGKQNSPVILSELQQVLTIDLGAGTGYCPFSEPQQDNNEREYRSKIWIESLSCSGLFRSVQSVPEEILTSIPPDVAQVPQRGSFSSSPASLVPLMETLTAVQATGFLWCQGLGAGFALFHLSQLASLSALSCSDILVNMPYEMTRRILGLLTPLSLLGVVTQTAKQSPQLLLKGVYATAFFLGLIISGWTAQLLLKCNNVSTWIWWTRVMMGQDVCLLLGWILVCLRHHGQQRCTRNHQDMSTTQAFHLTQRLQHVSGNQLQELALDELNELLQLHRTALEATEKILLERYT